MLNSNEKPVITDATVRELNSLVRRGKIKGLPRYLDEFEIIENSGSINSRIIVRGTMQSISNSTGTKIRGNLIGDGINGATALDANMAIITKDKLLKKALLQLGGDVR